MGAFFETIAYLSLVAAVVEDNVDGGKTIDRPTTENRYYGVVQATECREVEPGIYFAIGQNPITLSPDIDELRLQWKATSSFGLSLDRSILTLHQKSGYEEYILHDHIYSPAQLIEAGVSILILTDILPYLISINYAGIPFTVVEELYDTANQLAIRLCSPSPLLLNRAIGIDIGNTANQDSSLGKNQPLSSENSQSEGVQSGSGCKVFAVMAPYSSTPSFSIFILVIALFVLALQLRKRNEL